ncbi:MAG: c-type cytochrome [Proteobacteria bacterium]|nr:c-type cytochrome [Pseudomonadota bacterium]MDA0928437.1 c-type cytochrome [Pseudomonadota bacterium]
MFSKRSISVLTLALLALAAPLSSLAQSVADNIRPVGQVCLAGQPCVGTSGNTAGSSSPAATVVETVVEVVEEVADTAVAAAATVAAADSDFDPAATYQMNCFACHGTGAAGAPQPGDADAWEERMAKGMDAVMANVINGINAMPARGICMSCSDENLRAVVEYMLAQ